ncbi:MAG: NAD-dependent epimerase/dehydratase family protein [Sporichthyaceae bacterium]
MRVLILGGTALLGASLAEAATRAGHAVACLARGSSGPAPTGARFVRADRTGPDAYREVADAAWDVVIDLSRQPGQVRGAVAALSESARFWVFVSSGNVYAEHSLPGRDENATLLPALEGEVMESMETYGQAKVACERHVLERLGPDRTLVARAGLIGGPGDLFDRTGYWPLRFARPSTADGAVLVPDDPELATQVIDVRDLAGWLLDAARSRIAGVFNATGETVALAAHLELARAVAGHRGPLRAASPSWLLAHGVQEWMGERSLPLWLADPGYRGFNANDSAKARAAGLVTRPLEQTLADTLAWELTRDAGHPRRAGLSDDDERTLLAALAAAGS